MTALELMAACRGHGLEIARLEARIEELNETVIGCTVPLDREGGGGGGAGDRFSGYAARKDELERRLDTAKRAYAAEQMAVILITGEMPEIQRRTLKYFYCYGYSAARIADKLGYSVSNVYKAMAAAKQGLTKWTEAAVEEKLPGWYAAEYLT